MYKVIKYFTDLQDKEHPYHPGDTFPRDGIQVSAERLKLRDFSSRRSSAS